MCAYLKVEDLLVGLDDSDALQRFSLPSVVADFCGFSVAACCTSFVSHVVRSSSTAAAFDVDHAACAFAH